MQPVVSSTRFSQVPKSTRFAEFTVTPPSSYNSNASDTTEIVYVVEEDPFLREALCRVLAAMGRDVRAFARAEEYLQHDRPDALSCLLVDMRLSHMSGLEFQGRLKRENGPPVIFISAQVEITDIVRAMRGGAIEFLTIPISPSALKSAVEAAFVADRQLRLARCERQALQKRFSILTPREREVLGLVTEGLLNKQAAATLGISEVTLQAHRGQVMRKMAAGSFAELVRMADKLGAFNSQSQAVTAGA